MAIDNRQQLGTRAHLRWQHTTANSQQTPACESDLACSAYVFVRHHNGQERTAWNLTPSAFLVLVCKVLWVDVGGAWCTCCAKPMATTCTVATNAPLATDRCLHRLPGHLRPFRVALGNIPGRTDIQGSLRIHCRAYNSVVSRLPYLARARCHGTSCPARARHHRTAMRAKAR